jgi:Ca-activated chloride channel homolog
MILLAVVMVAHNGIAAHEYQAGLTIIEPDGKPGTACPLKHTSVKAEISSFVTRVEVKQIFHNPLDRKIEAVYTFPLSAKGAVNDLVMKVGKRVVRGIIRPRQEARQIYERARDKGPRCLSS